MALAHYHFLFFSTHLSDMKVEGQVTGIYSAWDETKVPISTSDVKDGTPVRQ